MEEVEGQIGVTTRLLWWLEGLWTVAVRHIWSTFSLKSVSKALAGV
jgi:hypothetical protein